MTSHTTRPPFSTEHIVLKENILYVVVAVLFSYSGDDRQSRCGQWSPATLSHVPNTWSRTWWLQSHWWHFMFYVFFFKRIGLSILPWKSMTTSMWSSTMDQGRLDAVINKSKQREELLNKPDNWKLGMSLERDLDRGRRERPKLLDRMTRDCQPAGKWETSRTYLVSLAPLWTPSTSSLVTLHNVHTHTHTYRDGSVLFSHHKQHQHQPE